MLFVFSKDLEASFTKTERGSDDVPICFVPRHPKTLYKDLLEDRWVLVRRPL